MNSPKKYLTRNVSAAKIGGNQSNLFSGKKGIGPEEIPPLCKNGTIIYANKEKADTLNDFFIEQATLENEDDPLPQVTFLDCEINDIII